MFLTMAMDFRNSNNFFNKKKINILCLTAFYLPGNKSGGPVRSISSIIEHLKDYISFDVLTSDRDINDFKSYDEIAPNKWNKISGTNIFYSSNSLESYFHFFKILRFHSYDILYINSFFNIRYAIFPIIIIKLTGCKIIKVVLAPRGEFSEGALKLKKIKKYFFVFLSKLFMLHKDIFWHVSSEYEAYDVKNILGDSIDHKKILIAPDLTNFKIDNLNSKSKIQMNPFKICFISRISPKKNLAFAISILSKLKGEIVFDIYGPIEDHKYWDECRSLIKNIPQNLKINYKGIISHDKIASTFSKYNLFFFPTLGENFGHVIIESICAGTPVLLTKNTPWRNLESKGVGWDFELDDIFGFVNSIQTLMSMSLIEYLKLRACVKEFGINYMDNPQNIEANLMMFQTALGKE
jgi:glycosyltransferase involved in cell wall biosynthesis